MTRLARALLALLVLGGLAAGPGRAAVGDKALFTPTAQGSPANVEFIAGSQTLLLQIPHGADLTMQTLSRPLRLVVNIPGRMLAPGRAGFETGVVSAYEVDATPTGSRVVLYLRKALAQKPSVRFYAGRVVISVVPSLVPRLQDLAPAVNASPFPSPRARPTPQPTGPGPRITPMPFPPDGIKASPRDIPPIQGGTP